MLIGYTIWNSGNSGTMPNFIELATRFHTFNKRSKRGAANFETGRNYISKLINIIKKRVLFIFLWRFHR